MDVYQIWTTYNKPWSKSEVFIFAVILAMVCILMSICLYYNDIVI